jgi:hypothetical protein
MIWPRAARLLRYLFLLMFAVVASVSAHSAEPLPRSWDRFKLETISNSDRWLKLLGYVNGKASDILTDSFFLATNGRQDPHAELLATLAAFAQPALADSADDHPQCKWRARFFYLDESLGLSSANIQHQPCPGFEAFSYGGHSTGVSLVFASGYFGNPASYYGHFLLKLDTDLKTITDLQKTTINFGAVYPPDENMIVYIFNGVFGGYDSIYSRQQFFVQSLNYGEVDLRDVWEYKLNLTASEVQLLTAHLWELLGVKYRYFFFDRNCAWRMATVIELVLDNQLMNSARLWQIPQHVVQKLAETQHHGAPLISEVQYLPSRQSRLYQRYLDLDKTERLWLDRIITDFDALQSPSFDTMPLRSRHRLLDVLLDYYRYLTIRGYMDENLVKKRHQIVLGERFRLPVGDSDYPQFSSHGEPHIGRKPSYLQVGLFEHDQRTEASIKIRPAYYDGLDYGSGHIRNSALSMAELDLETRDGELFVRSIGIVNVESIQRNVTNLPGDRQHSWYLSSAFIQENMDCTHCPVLAFNSGIGLSQSLWNDNLVASIFVGGGIEGDQLKEEFIHASGRLLLFVDPSPRLRMRFEVSRDRFISRELARTFFNFEGRLALSDAADLRLRIEDGRDRQARLMLGYYW